MKYEAINNRIIVKKPLEKTTDSGIILTDQKEGRVFEMEVVATTDLTKALQGRIIYCEPRNCIELNKAGDGYYGSIDIKDIVAIKA